MASKAEQQAPVSFSARRDSRGRSSRIVRYRPHILICLTVFLLYGNTIPHDYALDDNDVITGNRFTQKGLAGIPEIVSHDAHYLSTGGRELSLYVGHRYRPLSYVMFAVEYELFGLNPHLGHAINVLLYAVTNVLLFLLLSRLIPGRPRVVGPQWSRPLMTVPLVTTLLFLAHPLHTEVIANIKGRDDILAFLAALFALRSAISYVDGGPKSCLPWTATAFLAALLAKENAITFFAVIPLTIHFFTGGSRKQIRNVVMCMAGSLMLYFSIRFAVLGIQQKAVIAELLNNPFLGATTTQKYGTIFYSLGLYLKLLVFPYPLTWDYYPYHIQLLPISDPRALGSAVAYLALFVYAVIGFRTKRVSAYAILFYLITLSVYSNIVFPLGLIMNERFIYMSSLGFCILLAHIMISRDHLLSAVIDKRKHLRFAVLSIIILLYSAHTIVRNRAWKDNDTLFTTDIETSSGSAMGNAATGNVYLARADRTKDPAHRKENLRLARRYLRRAVAIYPKYENMLTLLGNVCVAYDGNFEEAIVCYERALAINPKRYDSNLNLGDAYFRTGRFEQAAPYLEKAIVLRPHRLPPYRTLALIYFNHLKDYGKAARILEAAVAIKPRDKALRQNLGLVYVQLGESAKAAKYLMTNSKM